MRFGILREPDYLRKPRLRVTEAIEISTKENQKLPIIITES